MSVFGTLHALAHFADRVLYHIMPKSRLSEWLCFVSMDAKVLKKMAADIALIQRVQERFSTPAAMQFVETTLFSMGEAYGKQRFYGLEARWSPNLLKRITSLTLQIDAPLWFVACESGYSDAQSVELESEAARYDEFHYVEHIEDSVRS
ncbi:TPA: hypothetical protein MYL90_002505 [Klebsiella pneumoniae]|nr:hypothetical protein [Klebsiella pneumoniae]